MSLSEVEKLIHYVTNPGVSNADLCKFLALETFAQSKISAIYTAEITEDGYLAPIATFGIRTQLLESWGNISLSIKAPICDAVKEDKVVLLKKEESLDRYPSLANYEAITEKWESYLVCPILPYGIIALALDSTPKVDKQFELFLKTIGGIAFLHFYSSKSRGEKGNGGHRDRRVKRDGKLSERQLLIKNLMVKGYSNPQIATEIGYSESLVRQETMAIFAALNISGRKELLDNLGGG